jgi:hypothetical protein
MELPGLSVLTAQQALNGGNTQQHSTGPGSGLDDMLSDNIDIDLRVPRFVAGLVLGAAVTLLLLRVAGFRFSFGAQLGAGS